MRIVLLLTLLLGSNLFFERLQPDEAVESSIEKSPEILKNETASVIQSKRIDESSGIVFSSNTKNAVWTHNDSRNKPRLFLISTLSGKTLVELTLDGAQNRDWEDMAKIQHNGINYLAIGDFGDNLKARASYQIYVLAEPEINLPDNNEVQKLSTTQWQKHEFTYEDGARNCESLGFDPQTKRLILVEKILSNTSGNSGVYELKIDLDAPQQNTPPQARKIASVNALKFSAMDISADGTKMALRAYHEGYFLTRQADQTWESVLTQPLPLWHELPMHKQGEGLCFYPDGKSILLSSEGKFTPLYKVQFPTQQGTVMHPTGYGHTPNRVRSPTQQGTVTHFKCLAQAVFLAKLYY